MKGYILTVVFVMSLLGLSNIQAVIKEQQPVESTSSLPQQVEKLNEFINSNESLLNQGEKDTVVEIIKKMKSCEAITQSELDYIREIELKIIKSKLGDAVFEEYCKLIKKRESKLEFTPPERFRLYEIEKALRN